MTALVQCLFLIALGGIIWNLRRDAPQTPMVFWTWAWLVAMTASFYVDQFENRAIAALFIPLFPAFLLAGAISYTRRLIPRWLLPAAIAFGCLLVLLRSGSEPAQKLDHVLSLAVNPAPLFAGGYLLYRYTRDSEFLAERLLPYSMFLLAVNQGLVPIIEILNKNSDPFVGWMWFLAGPSAIAIQMLSCHRWLQRSRLDEAAEKEAVREALDASQNRFRALTENSSQLILELDSEGRILYANPRVGELLGFGAEMLQNRRLPDFIHPDDRTDFERTGTDGEGATKSLLAANRWRRADGQWAWIESITRSFSNARGEIHWVVSAADITERRNLEAAVRQSRNELEARVEERTAELADAVRHLKREGVERSAAEEALRFSEEQFRVLSELSSDWNFIFFIGQDGEVGQYRAVGDRALENLSRVSGYSREKLLTMSYDDLILDEDRDRMNERFRDILSSRGPGPSQIEKEPYRILTSEGEIRWLDTVFKVEDLSDGRVRVIGAARDVTEHKIAEQERQRLEDHLRDVQRLESLGVLSDRIAHGFNNQLTVILGNSSLALMDTEQDTALFERLQRIRLAAQQSSNLTEQMLVYAGTATPSLKSIHLPHLVEGMRELLEASISRQCSLQFEIGNPLPLMEGDEGQLRQVAVNLVTNASESLGQESGNVWFRVGTMSADADYLDDTFGTTDLAEGKFLYLEIEDDGSGISSGDRGKIFEPFFSTRFSGRGLGLAAVLGIVQSHRGAIKLQSEPGTGTCIRILFPVSDGDTSSPNRGRTPKDAIEGRVLVVDDDDAVRELMTELLSRAGFEVLPATNGEEAVERMRAEGERISAIVLDIDMPGMDGGQALREIRELRTDVPVVVVTGHDEGEIGKRIGDQKVSGLVRKPFDEHELSETIQDAIQHAAE